MFQWLTGVVGDCSSGLNIRSTYFAYFLLYAQPLMFSVGGGIVGKWSRLWITLTLIFLAVMVTNVTILIVNTEVGIFTQDLGITSVISNQTCTLQGDNGHLAWTFKNWLIDFDLNYQFYLIGCIIPLALYEWDMWCITLSWSISLLVTFVSFRMTLREYGSTWCLFSVVSIPVTIIWILLRWDHFKEEIHLLPMIKNE